MARMNAPTRPAIRWHGGKWLLAPWIISHFPAHKMYIEPYGGGASVLLRKAPSAAEIYNDLDGRIVNLFRVLRDPVKALELKRRLDLTLFARAEFEWSYTTPVDDIDDAHKAIVLSFMGFGSDSVTRSCRTGFRAKTTGDGRALPSQAWASWHESIPEFVDRLRPVLIEQVDAIALMKRMDSPGVLFYADPPYVTETRSSLTGRSQSTHGYKHEMNDADHDGLIEVLQRMQGFVVLSGYASKLYDGALQGWRRLERKSLADGARPRIEVLWLNPACAHALDREKRSLHTLMAGAE
jgi:DNA adenine methylase